MPTIARIREGDTVRKHENKYGPGITPHYLETDQVGAVEFDSTLFSEDKAKEWLTAHDYKHFTLSEEEQADKEKKHRFLSIELAPSSEIQDVDGGLLVPGVRLLAPGTWTDSTQKTPCRYTAEVLERYCSNWTDRSYWSRHSGGTPRDITDRIADIRNIRYQDGVTADLFFHGATSKSLDAISLLKAAQAGKVPWPYSSVEMYTRDKWIVSEKLFEAQEILFDGSAMVNQGACRTCKIRNNAGVWEEIKEEEAMKRKEQSPPSGSLEELREILQIAVRDKFGKATGDSVEKYGGWIIATFPDHIVFEGTDGLNYDVSYSISEDGTVTFGEPVEVEVTYQPKKQEQNMTDTKELEAQIEALKKELAEAKAKPEPVKLEVPKELTDAIVGLNARLEKLEKAPADPKTNGTVTKELEGPIFFVKVDREAGTVR